MIVSSSGGGGIGMGESAALSRLEPRIVDMLKIL